ncbi:Hypothetical protein A7982_03521 [Minicystis rosea]|nr:Hypothetical protein A7982_03521 [Minicystis rosea]
METTDVDPTDGEEPSGNHHRRGDIAKGCLGPGGEDAVDPIEGSEKGGHAEGDGHVVRKGKGHRARTILDCGQGSSPVGRRLGRKRPMRGGDCDAPRRDGGDAGCAGRSHGQRPSP